MKTFNIIMILIVKAVILLVGAIAVTHLRFFS